MDDIIDIIHGGSGTETIIYPNITVICPHLQLEHSIVNATATIKSNMTTFIGNNFQSTYIVTKCERDLGYILDAARYDFMLAQTLLVL